MHKRNRYWDNARDETSTDSTYSSSSNDETIHYYKRPKLTENHHHPHNHPSTRHFTITLPPTTVISTTLTSHPGHVRKWVYSTLNLYRHHRHRLIGMGVQWLPSQTHASTLQLCIGRHCLIFSLNHAPAVPRVLRRLLANPEATFVGLWNHSDDQKLLNSKHRLAMQPGMPVDVRNMFDDNGLKTASIQEIAERRVGVDVGWDVGVSMSDWDGDVEGFSFGQVKQASLDAYVAFTAGMQFQAWRLILGCDVYSVFTVELMVRYSLGYGR